MQDRLTYTHILHLVSALRQISVEGQERAADYDDDGLYLCLAAGLMTDAADALEALLAERTANDGHVTPPRRDARRRPDNI
jgi:hypothetical protein